MTHPLIPFEDSPGGCTMRFSARCKHPRLSRRSVLLGGTAAVLAPFIRAVPPAQAALPRDIHFKAFWQGSEIGRHSISFRMADGRLSVETHIEITARVLLFDVFKLKHDARETWSFGRLVSVASTTVQDGIVRTVSGNAVAEGFHMVSEDGPFLAAANLLTTSSFWDGRIIRESRLMDTQNGGEVGLVATYVGQEMVTTPRGRTRASRYQIITPHFAGSALYDTDSRWIKAFIERKGETLEYALAN